MFGCYDCIKTHGQNLNLKRMKQNRYHYTPTSILSCVISLKTVSIFLETFLDYKLKENRHNQVT